MTIQNYTTTIAATRTISEIQAKLAAHKATRIAIDYDADGNPVALTFMLLVDARSLAFRLPANPDGVLRAMQQARLAPRYLTPAHALRVTWRILKNWVDAQLAIIEAQQAGIAEVFFPYAVAQSGRTLYQEFVAHGLPMLPPPPPPAGD